VSISVRPRRSAPAGLAIGVLLTAALSGCGSSSSAETSAAAPAPTVQEAAAAPTPVVEPRIAAPEVTPLPAGTEAEQVFGRDAAQGAYDAAVAFAAGNSFREPVLRFTDALTVDDFAVTGVSDDFAADWRSSVEAALASPDEDEAIWRNTVLPVMYSFEFGDDQWLGTGPLVTDFRITDPQATVDQSRIALSYREEGTVHALSDGRPAHVDLTKDVTLWLEVGPDGGWVVDGSTASWDPSGLLIDG